MTTSDEANRHELDLAREQGAALARGLRHMTDDVANDGGEKHAGDYIIGYAVESAEGLYFMNSGTLEWVEPKQENCHVEVSVRDGSDGRFIPSLRVYATLSDNQGNVIGTHEQPYLWHPWVYHYGRNWTVPGDGSYNLKIRIEPPEFPRHDKKNGKRFLEPVEVEFDSIQIKTGRK